MNRRHFLNRFAVVGAFLLAPKPSFALGGTAPSTGDDAPSFSLLGTRRGGGEPRRWTLDDLRGQWVVLYFYPRDFTSGCTIEAHGFQQMNQQFEDRGASIVGISADGVEDHASFCSSEELDFLLLSDKGGTVSKAYGSWMAPYSLRHTFLIDPQGKIQQQWTGVRPTGHAKEVFDALGMLQSDGTI